MERREKTIGLPDMLQLLKRNIVIIIASGLLLGSVLGVITHFLIAPKYQANTKSLVINQQDSNALTYSDFQSSTQFIEDYKEIVQSRSVLQAVIDKLQLTENLSELDDMLDVSIVNSTHHLKITVTANTPEKAQKIAEEVTLMASNVFEDAMQIQAVHIIDHANLPVHQSSPNLKLNIILGIVIGWILSFLIVLTRELLDDRINTTEDFTAQFDYPILGTIPYDSKAQKNGKKKKGGKKR